jgi:nucleoside-diphosphate-sugar epimerase
MLNKLKRFLGINMKVLIVGINTYMGKKLAEKYHSIGFSVISLEPTNIPYVKYIKCDIMYPAGLADIMISENPHILSIHNLTFESTLSAKLSELINITEAFLQSRNRRCIIYGSNSIEISDDTEISATTKQTIYHKLNEDYILYIQRTININVFILRYSEIYGPDNNHFINKMCEDLINLKHIHVSVSPEDVSNFLYIDDAVDINILLSRCSFGFGRYNVGDESSTYRDVSNKIAYYGNYNTQLITYNRHSRDCKL